MELAAFPQKQRANWKLYIKHDHQTRARVDGATVVPKVKKRMAQRGVQFLGPKHHTSRDKKTLISVQGFKKKLNNYWITPREVAHGWGIY